MIDGAADEERSFCRLRAWYIWTFKASICRLCGGGAAWPGDRSRFPNDRIVSSAGNSNFDEIGNHVASISLAYRRSRWPRPYICRFTVRDLPFRLTIRPRLSDRRSDCSSVPSSAVGERDDDEASTSFGEPN